MSRTLLVRPPSRRRRGASAIRVALVTASLLFGACSPAGDEEAGPVVPPATETEAGAPASAAAATPATAPGAPVSLGDLPRAVGRLEVLRQDVEAVLVPDGAEREAASGLDAALQGAERLEARTAAMPYDELVEVSRLAVTTESWVNAQGAVVSDRLQRVEREARRVAGMQATFDALAELAGRSGAPPQIRLRAGVGRAALGELAERLRVRRDELLVLVGKLAEVTGRAAALRADTESHLAVARARLAAGSDQPIWRLAVSGSEIAAVTSERLRRETHRIGEWFRPRAEALLLVALLSFGGTVLLLRRLRPGVARRAEADPAALPTLRLMESPLASATLVAVMAILVTSPPAPALLYGLKWLLVAPASAWVLTRMVGPRVERTAWVLAAALALGPVRTVLGGHPLTDRLTLLLQTAPLAVALALDLHARRFAGNAAGRLVTLLRSMGWALSACLGLAAVGSLAGWARVTPVLSSGALGTLGAVFLLLAVTLVFEGILWPVLASRAARRLRIVANHRTLVGSTLRRAFRIAIVVTVVVVALSSFRLLEPVERVLARLVEARLTLGTLSVSGGSILAFLLVLAATAFVTRVLGFLLAEEVLPRFDLGRGVAFAVSMTTRYLVFFTGFVLAAGAAGIDLSKIGFLAGALGVGVGLGLQNIVMNFVSGLILLFERPIQVGDAVDVSGATGTVTQIGIRASTVRTFDGAEVIVPNGDLISKPFTNWTLSDPNRRFDVKVGAAYGSPLESTAQALLAAARRTEGVHAAPRPEAFFQSFGESSLDWTLRVWVTLDDSPRVLSDLKRAVSEELAKAGIEIPFPQRDLHLRSVAPGASEVVQAPWGGGRTPPESA